jgi:hypothetical protein
MRHALRFLFVVTACTGLAQFGPARAESKASPQLAPLHAPKSEFNYRPGFTKDPFFPKSTEVIRPAVPNHASSHGTVPDYVVLRGVSIANGRKLAIINYQTVGENEEFTLKRGGKSVLVRCVEIKPQSVIVTVEGGSKELFLRVP